MRFVSRNAQQGDEQNAGDASAQKREENPPDVKHAATPFGSPQDLPARYSQPAEQPSDEDPTKGRAAVL